MWNHYTQEKSEYEAFPPYLVFHFYSIFWALLFSSDTKILLLCRCLAFLLTKMSKYLILGNRQVKWKRHNRKGNKIIRHFKKKKKVLRKKNCCRPVWVIFFFIVIWNTDANLKSRRVIWRPVNVTQNIPVNYRMT